ALEPAATPALGDPRHLLYPAICRTAVTVILFSVPPLQSTLTKTTLRPEGKDEPDGNDRRISHPRATPARLGGAQRSGNPQAIDPRLPGAGEGVRHRVQRQGRRLGRTGESNLWRQGDVVGPRPAAE